MSVEPIAIVGIGCRLPGGVKGPDDLWDLLINGVDAITEVPKDRWHLPSVYHPDRSKPGRTYARCGGFLDCIDQFDAHFFGINPREAAAADPQQRLLLEVAYEAVEDAGLTLAALHGKRSGVYVGISSFEYSTHHIKDRALLDAYTNLGSSLCIAANRISYFFNLLGPSLAVDTACSSSLVALDLACRSLWNGTSELAFVGGVNLMLRPETGIGFAKASMLAPDGRCKSFDARADGYVRGEGVGVVILKPLARALQDRDGIYCLIRATAVNQDGRTEGISVPSRASQEANLHDALRLADVVPASVQYVEAHGTGTPVGDPIEAAALGAVYGKARAANERCAIGSIKSNLGHLESASGIVGLIKTALCLQHRQIPATLHFENPNPDIPFDDLRLRVAQQLEPWPETCGQPPRAGVNSFGFGGTNGHAILEAAPERELTSSEPAQYTNGRAWVLPLSARSPSALSDLARSYLNALRDERALQHASLRDVCFSASVKRSHHDYRAAFVAHDKAELVEQLEAMVRGEIGANSLHSSPPQRPGTVFVCSGMGPQWWGMGRELLTQEPVYRRAVEEVNEIFRPLAGWSLLDEIIADQANSRIEKTHIAQPAIFALQIALAALWRSWGIEPAAVVGHSVGEVAASCICGALSLVEATQVVFHRSRLQARTAGEGSMLAAELSRADAERLLERYAGTLSVAAVNGPRSVTLSGKTCALGEIEKALTESGLFSRPLRVEVAYHSPLMEQLETELIDSLRNIRPRPASIPFFSTVTGIATTGTELDARYWYQNIRQPVLFRDVMSEIIKAGYGLFLEIGAHPVLRHDIVECLNEKSTQGLALCSLRREARERATLLGSLGQLYRSGAEIAWSKLFPAESAAIKLPSYPFQVESHWREADFMRRLRLGEPDHPLLGHRIDGPRPRWHVELGTTSLSYLEDHRIGGLAVFPGTGYLEAALATAREIFGSTPCVAEDVEFEKLLDIDQTAAHHAEVTFDGSSGLFEMYVRSRNGESSWDRHAQGCVRKATQQTPAIIDISQIQDRCLDQVDRDDFYALLARRGLDYGSSFRGIAKLWRGEREALAEINVPSGLEGQISDYRLHPAVLDACLQPTLATLPLDILNAEHAIFLPVKVARVRFQASLPSRIFSHVRLRECSSTQLTLDIQVLDLAGNRLVDIRGIVFRAVGRLAHSMNSIARYEYRWTTAPRPAASHVRSSHHLPSLEALAPFVSEASKDLWRRFERSRFQNEFDAGSHAVALSYIDRALHELGCTPAKQFAQGEFNVAPQHHRLLRRFMQELDRGEVTGAADPSRLWKTVWDEFPECHSELMLLRRCGESLAPVLRGEIDPLNLIFPEGSLSEAELFYQNSMSFRVSNLLIQKIVAEIVRSLPTGKTLRVLEIGGGTGGITSYVLPILSEYCSEYAFTDISLRFTARAQQKFAAHSFVQYRALDIELDPVEQGFPANSYDLIIAADVLHATRSIRNTLGQVKRLLASSGTLLLLELTRPWLYVTSIFGLLKGWWLFEDRDLRTDGPCLSAKQWRALLCETGFESALCFADCPDADLAQHSVILARASQLPISAPLTRPPSKQPKTWLVFADRGIGGRDSAGTMLARQLRDRGDRVIAVRHSTEFRQFDESILDIRPDSLDDMRSLMKDVKRQASRLAGIAYLWSLDSDISETMTSESLRLSANLGCVGIIHLMQAIAATEGIVIETLWLITRSAQAVENGAQSLQLTQSPVWGLGRTLMNEYQDLRCKLIDLTTCSEEEIAYLADELSAGEHAEDEVRLQGEARYLHRVVPISPATHRSSTPIESDLQPFRMQLQQPGLLDSLSARPLARTPPTSNEVEIEVAAAGLNFKDLMLATGMLPRSAVEDDPFGGALGFECAGRVVMVGDAISGLKAGDEVIAFAGSTFASHVTVDARCVVRKPRQLSLEQAATIPAAFMTAYYSLHTVGHLQPGERVLIHSGTGGVGLAAVQLALKAGAIVFATAGSPEKRSLLASIGVARVMDSRSLEFADELLELTAGEGVDVVLNSLAGAAIEKNLSLLRPYGRLIEIGKVDIYNNRRIGMRALRKNVSFFVVDLNTIFQMRPELARLLLTEIVEQFENEDLRPLPHQVFPATRLADAFRHMAQAKHVGKLIVSMQDTAGMHIDKAAPNFTIDPAASYLITGGLGGLGLAVAARLARRGARRLALLGRGAPSASAQAQLHALREGGTEVMVCQADIADRNQVQQVIVDVQRAMGPLRGIVHAAMVLDDAPIEHLSKERMWKAMAPKMIGGWNLHVLTADCPLDFFVMFSSIASIIGSPGQANYVAGNAFLEALAYYRRARGLPALTINWGAVGDFGHVANNQEIAGRLARLGVTAIPAAVMLDTLEELMSSTAVQVAAAKVEWSGLLRLMTKGVPARFSELAVGNAKGNGSSAGSHVRDILQADPAGRPPLLEVYLRDCLARAIGASPIRIDTQQPLRNLGLDSLIAVDVRNRINADFGVNISLTNLMQGASIKSLAAHTAEQLNRGPPDESCSIAKSQPSLEARIDG